MATTGPAQAKRPISMVAGPYGHPFHPLLVTVPIGAWVSSLVFDVVSQYAGEAHVFAKGAFWLVAVGVVGALVAATFGFMDLLAIPRGTSAFSTALTHMALNLGVVVLFAVNFGLRQGALDEGAVDVPPIVLSVVALALLALSGWLGGKLTYRYGVRVVDEATQADGYR